MTHFTWTSDLEIGHEVIDAQHQSLFALANELQDAVEDPGAESDAVADCVWALTDYVVQHFADEEELMTEAGYPALTSHHGMHDFLTGEVLRLAARYMSGEDVTPASLAPFLADWLTGHISTSDREFVAFLEREG